MTRVLLVHTDLLELKALLEWRAGLGTRDLKETPDWRDLEDLLATRGCRAFLDLRGSLVSRE